MSSRLSAVVAREMRLLSLTTDTTTVTITFVLAAVLLAGLAFGPVPATLAAVGPGAIWLVALLSVAPQARDVAAVERDEGTWDLLRAVTAPTHLLVGKSLALWLRLLVTWAGTAVLVAAVFDIPLPVRAWPAAGLGMLGLAVVTVALGVMVSGARSGSGSALLTTLVLPLSLPILIAGTMLTTADVPTGPWFLALVGMDVMLLAVVWATFPTLLEE